MCQFQCTQLAANVHALELGDVSFCVPVNKRLLIILCCFLSSFNSVMGTLVMTHAMTEEFLSIRIFFLPIWDSVPCLGLIECSYLNLTMTLWLCNLLYLDIAAQ